MINQQIQNYKIISLLGEGGMAHVYLAEHTLLRQKVAVKVLKISFVQNPNIRKRFLAEARILGQMNHLNIIKVTDLIDAGDIVAFVMEYIEGQTLKDYLLQKGKLSIIEVETLFNQMLLALEFIHDKGLIHRDIKPSNFMVSVNGSIKLLDFGIAKNTNDVTDDYTCTNLSQQMGTPIYMSPEQVRSSKEVTFLTDIFSLGVVLWQLASGQKPYGSETTSIFDLQLKIAQEHLPLTNTKWDKVIQKATQKKEKMRFQSANEFLLAINKEEKKWQRKRFWLITSLSFIFVFTIVFINKTMIKTPGPGITKPPEPRTDTTEVKKPDENIIEYGISLNTSKQLPFKTKYLRSAEVKMFPRYSTRKELGINYLEGVFGINQFLMDHDLTSGFVHDYTRNFFNKLSQDGYLLVFERSTIKINEGNISYKRKKNLLSTDKLGHNIAFCRQWKLSEIDIKGDQIMMQKSKYNSSRFCPQVKKITSNPFSPEIPIWSNSPRAGYIDYHTLNSLTDYDGGTVVIVWSTPKNEILFMDLHGSISDIISEAIKIKDQFKVDPTIGVYDAGPFARKFKADKNDRIDFSFVDKSTGTSNLAGAGYAYLKGK